MNVRTTRILQIISVICIIISFFQVTACADTTKPVKDNVIISLILTGEYEGGGYTIVTPQTGLPFHLDFSKPEQIQKHGEYIKNSFRQAGYDIDTLVDRLFERNSKSYRLTLDASPENGYIIDYDGRYAYYFSTDNPEWERGWQRLREDYPDAHGITTLSLPVYDPATGFVLAYVGWQGDYVWGEGNLILYRYGDGQLRELFRLMVWIS